jgi:hypothetical protein
MTDDLYHGIFAVLMFGILSAIGAIVFSISLMVAMLSKIRNQKPMKTQPGFGYLVGSMVPFVTGLIGMYSISAVHQAAVRQAFDTYGCFIVMVIALAVMIYIGRRWKYRFP